MGGTQQYVGLWYVYLFVLLLPFISANDPYRPYIHQAEVPKAQELTVPGEYTTQLYTGAATGYSISPLTLNQVVTAYDACFSYNPGLVYEKTCKSVDDLIAEYEGTTWAYLDTVKYYQEKGVESLVVWQQQSCGTGNVCQEGKCVQS